MKNQKKNSDQPRFTLPDEVCEACGFQAEDAMSLHAGPGALVILPDRMKVMERQTPSIPSAGLPPT